MRNLASFRDLDSNGRMASIHRVSQKETQVVWMRPANASTIHGPASDTVACTVVGRFDIYALRASAFTEVTTTPGQATAMRLRFEVPFPTDAYGNTVDIQHDDTVTYNGDTFRATAVHKNDGYIEVTLESWS